MTKIIQDTYDKGFNDALDAVIKVIIDMRNDLGGEINYMYDSRADVAKKSQLGRLRLEVEELKHG